MSMNDKVRSLEGAKAIVKFCNTVNLAMEHFGNDEEDFLENELYQSSCGFALIQIGEAVKRISDEIKEEYPEIEWSKIAGMRDFIAHSYQKANMHIMWMSMTCEVPILKTTCEIIISKL